MARGGRRPPRRVILGLLLLSVSILTALSLPGLGWGQPAGPFGAMWVLLWAKAFGTPSLWVIVATGLLWSIAFLARWPRRVLWNFTLLIGPVIVAWDALAQRLWATPGDSLLHGLIGRGLWRGFGSFFGGVMEPQTAVALATLALTLTVLLLRWGVPPPVDSWVAVGCKGVLAGVLLGLRFLARVAWRLLVLIIGRGLWPVLCRLLTPRPRAVPAAQGQPACDLPATRTASADAGSPTALTSQVQADIDFGAAGAAAAEVHSGQDEAVSLAGPAGSPVRRERASRAAKGAAPPRPVRAADGVAIVPLELLDEHTASTAAVSEEEIRRNAALLKSTLASFGIQTEIGEVQPGPVITRYEVIPGPGVTISQISSRQDDIALALRAPRVRLLAPIPGKAAVGVEIPNQSPALISFREIAGRREFREAREPLCVALGEDVAGRPFYASLEKMPHLLVAGTTGSGKSVCLNTLIVSLLMRCTPEMLRLLLIDPKMLELTTYNEIPHLLRPVVTEPREAARALLWLTREMERRYRQLAGLGVRNIGSYLTRRAAGGDDPPLPAMPYIVVFVDELADLMLANQSEIEVPIARLAQMARAVGIHLVLATQRPSVDVLTGIIKANFPARIAFQVATRTDSRTILDSNGAESLIGRGDMLYIPPGKAQAHRVHGAYLSDAETERVAQYLREFAPPEPIEDAPAIETENEVDDDLEDPLYHEALRVVVGSRQGSTSLLQRRLRVGYTRAGRLMDLLERAGVVGPPDGSRAREVLVGAEFLGEVEARGEKVAPRR